MGYYLISIGYYYVSVITKHRPDLSYIVYKLIKGYIMNGYNKIVKRELIFLFLFSYSAGFWALLILLFTQLG